MWTLRAWATFFYRPDFYTLRVLFPPSTFSSPPIPSGVYFRCISSIMNKVASLCVWMPSDPTNPKCKHLSRWVTEGPRGWEDVIDSRWKQGLVPPSLQVCFPHEGLYLKCVVHQKPNLVNNHLLLSLTWDSTKLFLETSDSIKELLIPKGQTALWIATGAPPHDWHRGVSHSAA